eukprot:scaffold9575_cov116-Isochrysis_galbana.AAC.1
MSYRPTLDSGPSAGHRPMDGRFLLLVLGFAPCPVLPFAREKARLLVSVIVLGVTLATKVPVGAMAGTRPTI